MLQQYLELKDQVRDALLLYRLGDFYELFFEDAQTGAQLLNVALTKRGVVPMCGIPFHAANAYVGRLLKAGRKVAICDQVEEARDNVFFEKLRATLDAGDFRRHAGPDNGGHVLHPGPAPAFLVAALQNAGQARPAVLIEDAHPFRPVKTVRGKRNKAGAPFLRIHRQPAGARVRIHIKRNPALAGQCADLADRLNRADFMVDVMDGN